MFIPDDFLEVEAQKVLATAKDASAANTALLYSATISLKRIADALEGMTGNDGALCAYVKGDG